MTEKIPETPITSLGAVLHQTLQQIIERKLGESAYYSFKDPKCDISREAYRSWTLFIGGSADSDNLTVRITNDNGVNKTFTGPKDQIDTLINADEPLVDQAAIPSAEEILAAINEDFYRRLSIYEAWKLTESKAVKDTAAETATAVGRTTS